MFVERKKIERVAAVLVAKNQKLTQEYKNALKYNSLSLNL